MTPRIPREADFPDGTRFVIKEFDVPLVQIPAGDSWVWLNWYGGVPKPYDEDQLDPGNNWAAESFYEWADVVARSLPG